MLAAHVGRRSTNNPTVGGYERIEKAKVDAVGVHDRASEESG